MGALAGLSGAAILGLGAPGHAGSVLTFDATADASGQHTLVHVPGAPLTDDVVDAGGNRAVARVNSLGTSQARAAAPHPGDLAISAPGLLGGLAPLPVPLPAYPLVADSSYPATPSSDASRGGVKLTAASAIDKSMSTAAVEGAAPGAASATAHVDIVSDRDAVTSHAVTTVTGFSAGPLVIDGLTATATVHRRASGVTKKATLSAAKITVSGTGVTLDSRGLTLAGTTIPLEQASPLVAALSSAGVTLKYVHAQETKDGITAPSVVVTTTRDVPPNPAAAVPSITYTLILGEASAVVRGSAFDDSDGFSGDAPTTPTSGGPGSAGIPARGAPPLAGLPAQPVAGARDAAPPPIVPSGASGTSPPLAQQAAVSPVAWSATFYLALAGSAVLLVLVLTLVRYLGVRYP